MTYTQRYLREQGLAVTWDNPDIQLYREGVAVSSTLLEAGTEYEIGAQIWNNSTSVPAGSGEALCKSSFSQVALDRRCPG